MGAGDYFLFYVAIAMLGFVVWMFVVSGIAAYRDSRPDKLWPLFTVAWPCGILCLVIYSIVATVKAIGSILE